MSELPWYRRTLRWGQTNLTEIDPVRYDSDWWRDYWRRTHIQGVIVNAGGIVAYYPSKLPLHHQAEHLGGRDLYGEIVAAAREDELVVIARMDSNRAHEPFHVEHPDWFAVDRDGRPYRAGELYVACINSPYYTEYLPAVLTEIIERSSPAGFADNSWSGLDREHICYCRHCESGFQNATGARLPAAPDWDDPAYRSWITWSYTRRTAIWDLNNGVTRAAGGPDCLWVGMMGGHTLTQAVRLRDVKAISERSEIIFLDSQARRGHGGFQANATSGDLLHGVAGWDVLIPESTAMYNAGDVTFRLAAKPRSEARMWALSGFSVGIQPWWHHIGAYHEDRRQYQTAEEMFAWHAANERHLVDRHPAATVGVVWSQENTDFYGRDAAEERTESPFRGVVEALIRARIPYQIVHADDIGRSSLAAVVLPNVAILSDAQCVQIREFASAGGGLVATGETGGRHSDGRPREDFALADLFGAHSTGAHHGSTGTKAADWAAYNRHTYLRLPTENRPSPLDGFEHTDILPFGGRLEVVAAEPDRTCPITFIPAFPIYPPETSWMRVSQTELPAVVLTNSGNSGRVAYVAADIDRCYDRDRQPDHGDLLANLVRWTARGNIPISVEGPGLVDCHLYEQTESLILHLVNLTGTTGHRGPIDEIPKIGPLAVRVNTRRPTTSARLLVTEESRAVEMRDGWAAFDIPSLHEHEVAVLGGS